MDDPFRKSVGTVYHQGKMKRTIESTDIDETEREFKKTRYFHTFSKEYAELFPYLIQGKTDEYFAHCTVCSCDFSIKYGGLEDCWHHIEIHARSQLATLDTKVIPAPALGKYEEVYSQESCDVAADLPAFWAPMERGAPVMAFEVVPDTEEYRSVANQFYETCPFGDYDIARIIRVQNHILWKHFVLKQSEMIQENDGMDVVVKELYHGTLHSTLEAIARKGFDWRLSGKNGTRYGNGSYFASTAQYSHDYTDCAGSGVSVRTSGASSSVLQSGGTPSSVLQSGVASSSVLQSGGIPSSVLQSGGTPSSVLQSGGTSSSVLQSGGTSSSVLQSGGTPSSVLQSGGTSSSVLQSGGTPSSVLQSGGTHSSVLQSGGTPSSMLQSGGTPSSVLQSGGTPSSVLQSGGTSSSVLQSGGTPSSVLQSGGTSSSVLQSGGTPSSVLQSGGTPSSVFQSGGTSSSVLQSGGTQSSVLQSGGTPSSVLQSGGTSSSVLQSGGTPSSVLQSGCTSSSMLQSGGTPSSVLQSGGTPSSVLQSGGTPSSVLQSGGTPSSVLQSGGTPSSVLQSGGTPSSVLQSGGTPSSVLQSAGTPSSVLQSGGTPSSVLQSGGTPSSVLQSGGTPSSVLQSGGTSSSVLQSGGTPSSVLQSGGTPSSVLQSGGTPSSVLQSGGSFPTLQSLNPASLCGTFPTLQSLNPAYSCSCQSQCLQSALLPRSCICQHRQVPANQATVNDAACGSTPAAFRFSSFDVFLGTSTSSAGTSMLNSGSQSPLSLLSTAAPPQTQSTHFDSCFVNPSLPTSELGLVQTTSLPAPSLWDSVKDKKADIQIKPDPDHTPNYSGSTTVLQCRGKGTSNLSSAFAFDANSKTHFMFVAKVLVGRHTGGKSGLNRPPPLDDSNPYGKYYDSCVDDISSPQVYAIFDSNQAYPEYIIEYNWHKS